MRSGAKGVVEVSGLMLVSKLVDVDVVNVHRDKVLW